MNHDLESQLKGLEAIAEQYYPANIAELARLTNQSESVAMAKIEYIAEERGQSKYIVLDMVLTYHRINWTR